MDIVQNGLVEEIKMATIKEIAEKCGVSEQAIRGWCKRNQVAKDERKAYILSQEVESSIYAYYTGVNEKDVVKGERKAESNLPQDSDTIELLKTQMQMLQNELSIKNKQIADLSDALKNSQESLRASQLLQANTEQKIKLLEQKGEESAEEPKKKHWWQRKEK